MNQIKTLAAAYLAKAGCSIHTTAVGVDRMNFAVNVVVATVEEVVIAKGVAEAFKAKLGWDMSVELAVKAAV